MKRTRKVLVLLFSMLLMAVAFAPVSSVTATAAPSGSGNQNGHNNGVKGKPIQLASDGAALYEIVVAPDASDVDLYAADILADYLQQMTEAPFSVVTPDEMTTKNSIYVGLSVPALQKLRTNPLSVLADQEHVARSIGKDIYLYGKGIHGTLYAVMDFLEDSLDWRWYSNFEEPVFTVDRELRIANFNRISTVSFQYRHSQFEKIFDYQQGINMGFTERQVRTMESQGTLYYPEGVVSLAYNPEFVHATPNYIPPTPTWPAVRTFYEWVTNRYYWQTNPEFFTMKSNGQRTPEVTYCFSNPGLRAELTANVMEHFRRLEEQGFENPVITIDTHDGGGKMCYCPECAALEAEYDTPGGPLFDYLIELCAQVAEEYPQARIKTSASRVEKTAIPPTLPEGVTWPDNLIVFYANISDRLDRDWSSPDNCGNYELLQQWMEITPHMWTWYYPNPYGLGQDMPFAGIRRQVADLRRMYDAGVEGVFFEFTTPNVHSGEGFIDLQKYIYAELTQDINQDEQDLIVEYTDSVYGPAAQLVRQYLEELEDAHEASLYRLPLTILSIDFETTLAYLTVERLMRWHQYFDEMEALVADDAHRLENVQRLRRNIELATLGRWHDMVAAYPDYFTDYEDHIDRVGPQHAASNLVTDFVTIIQAGPPKPLPEQFLSLPVGSVVRYMPTNYSRGSSPKIAVDPEAAYGYAATIDLPDQPFYFGYAPRVAGMDRVEMCITNDNITPDVYTIYHLGLIKVMPDPSIIYFSNASWMTHLLIGEKLYVPESPENDNIYDVYVSLKFSGEVYGGTGDTQVLCDQIILVRQMALD